MKHSLLVLLVACGGSKPAPKAPPEPVKEPPAPVAHAEPEVEAPPPAPTSLHAKAALQPVKGAKAGAGTVSFAQEGTDETTVTSDDFDLRPGSYRLVIHDGESCASPGDAWKGAATAELALKITRDTRALEDTKVKLDLGGVAPAVGHVLVLHEDKKGKPGKALACGPIEGVGAAN